MIPVHLSKFGKYANDKRGGDTPVSMLSNILSKASFDEAESNGLRPVTLVPADFDESANQEPPLKNLTWFEATEQYSAALTLGRESSNSCSSGYHSSSSCQSAPPTCNSARSFQHVKPSNDNLVSDNLPVCQLLPNNYPATLSDYAILRRTQSCTTRGWLNKRHRKQTWPRISGILKSTSSSFSPSQILDTNSCPASLSGFSSAHDASKNVERFSLPPVGETCFSPDGSPSRTAELIEQFTLSPQTTLQPVCRDPFPDFSPVPQAKKQRTDEDILRESTHDVPLPVESHLDSTVLLDQEANDHSAHPLIEVPNILRLKPPFEVFRHHSTPMMSARSARAPYACPDVTSPMQLLSSSKDPLASKPALFRSVSVPVQTVSEKLHRCAGVLDNANFRCLGRRPRALPVVQRTDSGLHCVSIDTVAELVTDAGEKRNISFVIVDCRFPYEYEGGHIRDAINIFTHSDLVQEIFNRVPAQRPPGKSGPPKLLGGSLARRLSKAPREPLSAPCEPISDEDDSDDYVSFDYFTSEASQLELAVATTEEQNCSVHSDDALGARSEPSLSTVSNGSSSSGSTTTYEPAFVVIFHCEFSSQRAPDLATFLRNIDRISNYHRYPFLYFPEIYIMKGGYSAFYQSYPHLCAPDNYVKMSHRDYRTQFRIYRRLTKRVSSACIACIRPQHKLLHSPIVDTVTSFDQPSVGRPTSSTVVQPTPSSTSKTCTNLLSAVVLGGEVTPSAATDSKENLPPIYVNVTKVDAPHRLSSLHSSALVIHLPQQTRQLLKRPWRMQTV